ncbi:MAG TPA: DUF192 domain-containing protein [Thermoanaerobaculia bacterium]|nr:DUF192 domain-containing protein [Thermoanaerobaculia bacterium]
MTRRARSVAALFAALAATASCGAGSGATVPAPTPSPAAAAPAASASGPRITMPSGAVYRLELALTPEDQAQGLMYRESLPPNAGMLFVFDQPAPHHFWMKNTMIPLDMIWMDDAGKVLYVSADTPPCKADPCATYGPDSAAKQVLEIAGGKAKEEKVAVGSVLRIDGVK